MRITRKFLKEKMWECANKEHENVMFVWWVYPYGGKDPVIGICNVGTEEGIAERWIDRYVPPRDVVGFFDILTYDQPDTKSWFAPDSGMNTEDALRIWHGTC